MLGMIISKIVFAWSPIHIKLFWRTLSVSQWYLISMAVDLFCLIVSFKIPKAVELSILSGVAGCVCPNTVRVTVIGAPLWCSTLGILESSADL
jgi:hypothetical protein